jgi:hypothetical protein
MGKIKLNLGCGCDLKPGYINCDNFSTFIGDRNSSILSVDLCKFPWPFDSNSASEILMNHILEHLPDIPSTMIEILRILEPGGVFCGEVPYGPNLNSMNNWQHCHWFIPDTLTQIGRDFGFKCVSTELITWECGWKQRIRNLVPFRKFLAQYGWGIAFDAIQFRMIKS